MIPVAHQKHPFVPDDLLHCLTGVVGGQIHQTKIQLALNQRCLDLTGAAFQDLHLHMGIYFLESRQQCRQQNRASPGSNTDPDHAGTVFPDIRQFIGELPFQRLQTLYIFPIPLSSVCQLQRRGAVVKKSHTQFFFQLLHIFAQGRLGEVQRFCRPAQATLLHDGKKIMVVFKVQIASLQDYA